jgi:uncharacterized membrane protein (DUF2068 family)
MVSVYRLVVAVLLAAAAFVVWRVALPAGKEASTATGDAAVSLLDTRTDARFAAARANLDTSLRVTGSYAGATMPEGVALVRADDGAYCVQVGPPGTIWHLTGPGGAAATGPC